MVNGSLRSVSLKKIQRGSISTGVVTLWYQRTYNTTDWVFIGDVNGYVQLWTWNASAGIYEYRSTTPNPYSGSVYLIIAGDGDHVYTGQMRE